LIVERGDCPVYYAKWRDGTRRQVKRRLGPARLDRDGDDWKRLEAATGTNTGGLSRRASCNRRDGLCDSGARQELAVPKPIRDYSFAEAAQAWLHHLEHVEGVKPSTLVDYRYMLVAPDTPALLRGRKPIGRIMQVLGARPLNSIVTRDVKRWLQTLDSADISPRTINKHRQVLASVFEYAISDGEYGVFENPVRGTPKRREADPRPIDTHSPEEMQKLARAARSGLHRDPTRPAVSDYERLERAWEDEQDACIYIVAAFTGIRMGELLALRWRHVSFEDARILVEAAYSGSSARPSLGTRKPCP
jgi:integrase